MNTKTLKPTDTFPNGTSLQGYVTASYDNLVAVFGEPNQSGDDYKVAFEWVLESVDGEIVTIYPWKNTNLYEEGLPGINHMKNTNTRWHIGGKSKMVVDLVLSVIEWESER